MVTTRLDGVALLASHNEHPCIYRMKHLEEQDSRRLFFNRVLWSENICPPQFNDIADEILKKCDGLPLAIITIAGLLASNEARSLNEWESIKNALGAKSSTQPTLEEMSILNLSYIHLPLHLRPCLLYLGMYPEDQEIERNNLVQQWIAEGFVSSSPGLDLDDVAKGYFSDLINRSLIQPVGMKGGEVISCRVHDMLLDLILSKSTEDNFISVAYNYEDMARLHGSENKVRRLSLKSNASYATSQTLATRMPQVRSYAQFGQFKYTPPLSKFKYLRVLLFEFPDVFTWRSSTIVVDLTAIGHLFLLRYLKVSGGMVAVALPTEIQELVHLETLELHGTSTDITCFPSDISCLANLIHLILPYYVPLPARIQKMKSVRTLHCSGISENSVEDIKGVSELTNLKELRVYGEPLTVEHFDALVSSIGTLQDLKYLLLDFPIESGILESRLYSLPDPPLRLEVLILMAFHDGKFSRIPKWIGELRCLRLLSLCVLHLSSDEVRVLGELPSLVSATFNGLDVSQDIVFSTGLFPVLEDIELRCTSRSCLCQHVSFEAGAMPNLHELSLGFGWKEWRGATPVGMECLPCLQHIRVWLRDSSAKSSKNLEDVRADVKSAFKSAVRLHPKHPSVIV